MKIKKNLIGFSILLNLSFPVQFPNQEGKVAIGFLREDFVNTREKQKLPLKRGF